MDNGEQHSSPVVTVISAVITAVGYVYAFITESSKADVAWWIGSIAGVVVIISGVMTIIHKHYETIELRKRLRDEDK